VAHQVEREVERRHGRHHPDRHPLDEAETALARRAGVEGHHLAGEGAGHRGGEAHDLDGPAHLGPGRADGLGRLGRDQLREGLRPVFEEAGGPLENPGPAVGGQPGATVAVEGHTHRLVDIDGGEGGHRPDEVPVPRGADLEDGVALHRFAVDEGRRQLAAVEQSGGYGYHFTMTCLSSV
jgi:hypothetical protein